MHSTLQMDLHVKMFNLFQISPKLIGAMPIQQKISKAWQIV